MYSIVGTAVNHSTETTPWATAYGAAKCFVGNTLIVFGGLIGDEATDSLSVYEISPSSKQVRLQDNGELKLHIHFVAGNSSSSNSSTETTAAPLKPSARYGATLTKTEQLANCIVMIGGNDGRGTILDEVWLLDRISFSWQLVSTVSTATEPTTKCRFLHKAIALSDGNILILGGYSSDIRKTKSRKLAWDHDFGSAWILNVVSWTWKSVSLAVPPTTSSFFPFPLAVERTQPTNSGDFRMDEYETNIFIQNYRTKEFEWWSERPLTEESLASLHVREKQLCHGMMMLGQYIICVMTLAQEENGSDRSSSGCDTVDCIEDHSVMGSKLDLCRNLAVYDTVNKQKVNNVDFVFDSLDMIQWNDRQRNSLIGLDTQLRFKTESDFLYPITLGLWISFDPPDGDCDGNEEESENEHNDHNVEVALTSEEEEEGEAPLYKEAPLCHKTAQLSKMTPLSYVTMHFHSRQKQAFFEAMVLLRNRADDLLREERLQEMENYHYNDFWKRCPAPLITCVLNFL